jgi:5-formyltetrahydrofolate cyclo-ligase
VDETADEPVDSSVDKAALRRAILSRRAALPPHSRERIAATAVEVLLPRVTGPVAAYLSVGTEPGTDALIEALAEYDVLLPVLLPDGDLDWCRAGDGVAPGPHGLLEPRGPRLGRDAISDCTTVVVPALAVDRHGNRLGPGRRLVRPGPGSDLRLGGGAAARR